MICLGICVHGMGVYPIGPALRWWRPIWDGNLCALIPALTRVPVSWWLLGLVALLLTGCTDSPHPGITPTRPRSWSTGRRNAGTGQCPPVSDAPLALVFRPRPLGKLASWLKASEGKQVQGSGSRRRCGRNSIFRNVQPDKRYEVFAGWTGPIPSTGPQDRLLRLAYRERHRPAPLRDDPRPPISAVNVDEVNIDFFRAGCGISGPAFWLSAPGAGMGKSIRADHPAGQAGVQRSCLCR